MPCTISELVDLGSSGIVRYGDDAVVSVAAVARLADQSTPGGTLGAQ